MKTSSCQNLSLNPFYPGEDSLTVSYFKEGEFRKIDFNMVAFLSPQDLCNKPFVFRFDTPQGRVYFAGTEGPYMKLKSEAKDVRWLHDLIEYWRQDLVMRGLPEDTWIYRWRLKDMSVLQKALIVFPDHQGVEVRQ